MNVYGVPDHVHVPDFDEAMVDGRYSMEKDIELGAKFAEDLKAYLVDECKCTGTLTGEVVRFPIADGYAMYMVGEQSRTTFLVHMPLGDAWQIPEAHARGLRKPDIKDLVGRQKKLAAIFGKKG